MSNPTSGAVLKAADFIIETLSTGPLPDGELFDQAIAAGIELDDYRTARRQLLLTGRQVSYTETTLHTGPCIACGEETPFRSRYDLGPLHPTCTAPDSVWEWKTAPTPGKRKTITVRVTRRPTGWIHTGSATGYQPCNSVFDRHREGRPNCADLTTWRVERFHGRQIHTSWWCDADLPDEYRPDLNEAEQLTGQDRLFT